MVLSFLGRRKPERSLDAIEMALRDLSTSMNSLKPAHFNHLSDEGKQQLGDNIQLQLESFKSAVQENLKSTLPPEIFELIKKDQAPADFIDSINALIAKYKQEITGDQWEIRSCVLSGNYAKIEDFESKINDTKDKIACCESGLRVVDQMQKMQNMQDQAPDLKNIKNKQGLQGTATAIKAAFIAGFKNTFWGSMYAAIEIVPQMAYVGAMIGGIGLNPASVIGGAIVFGGIGLALSLPIGIVNGALKACEEYKQNKYPSLNGLHELQNASQQIIKDLADINAAQVQPKGPGTRPN